MAYLALRPIKIAVLDEQGAQVGVRQVHPGEVVPATNWTYAQIIAHLNLHLMEWVEEKGILPPHTDHKRAKVIDMREYRNERRVPTKATATAGLQRGATPGAQPEHTPLKNIDCPHCESKFGNRGSLTNHIKHKHRETPGNAPGASEEAGQAG